MQLSSHTRKDTLREASFDRAKITSSSESREEHTIAIGKPGSFRETRSKSSTRVTWEVIDKMHEKNMRIITAIRLPMNATCNAFSLHRIRRPREARNTWLLITLCRQSRKKLPPFWTEGGRRQRKNACFTVGSTVVARLHSGRLERRHKFGMILAPTLDKLEWRGETSFLCGVGTECLLWEVEI